MASKVFEIIAKMNSSGYTAGVKDAQSATKGLDGDIKACQKSMDNWALSAKALGTKVDLRDARKELNALTKELDKITDKNSDFYMDTAIKATQARQNVENLSAEYKNINKQLREVTENAYKATDAMGQPGDENGEGGSGMLGAMNGLVRMRMFAQLGQATQQYVFALGKSYMGEIQGSEFSNVLGGALSGAILGSYMAPGVGTAAGAVIGGVTGLVQTETEKLEREDDAFKAEVQNLYSQVTQNRETELQAGIEYAATEQSNLKALGILLGNQEKGNQLYQELKNYGINTMYKTPNMLTSAKRMLAYGVDENQIVQAVKWIGDVAMGDQSKFDSLAYVYGQTASAGKLTGQDLRQYTEAGFNPLAWLAEERGTTLEAMREEMSAGKVLYQDVMHAFELATAEGAKFGGSAEAMMNTYAGKMSKLADLQDVVNSGYGAGYNRVREEGMDREIAWYEGEQGDLLHDAKVAIGEYEAELENMHQEAILKAYEDAMNSEEYKRALATDNSILQGEILQRAEAQAEMDWNNSELMLEKRKNDIKLIEDIGKDLSLDKTYVDLGIAAADAFTVGFKGRYREAFTEIFGEKPNMWGATEDYHNWYVKYHAGEEGLMRFNRDGSTRGAHWSSGVGQAVKQAGDTINETVNTSQTFNVSSSVVVNEATDGAKIANMINSSLGSLVKSVTKSAPTQAGGKWISRKGH